MLYRQARTHGEPFAGEVNVMREEIVAFVTGLIGAAAREAHHDPALPDRDVTGLAQALVGAAEALMRLGERDSGCLGQGGGGHLDELLLGRSGEPYERPSLAASGAVRVVVPVRWTRPPSPRSWKSVPSEA